jgi:hypothetical protein
MLIWNRNGEESQYTSVHMHMITPHLYQLYRSFPVYIYYHLTVKTYLKQVVMNRTRARRPNKPKTGQRSNDCPSFLNV